MTDINEAMRDAIDAGLRAFCADTEDFDMSAGMRRAATDFIMGQPGMFATPKPPVDAGAMRSALQPFLRAAEPILHNDRDRWDPDEWHNRLNNLTVGQFRALHAAAIRNLPDAGEPL